MAKKVFVSHASEDKKRFVNGFATKLVESGIDAWYDKWEIQPGDSLVDRIFQEGIGQADCIVIVLSKFSVEKDWVRKELNISIVKQVQEKIRLIPVVIEDCQIPTALLDTRYVRIADIRDYQSELEEMVMSIEGLNDKPPIGSPPAYIQIDIAPFPGLNKIDTEIFNRSCQVAQKEDVFTVGDDEILEAVRDLNLSPKSIDESLDILDSESYIRTSKATGGALTNSHFNITTYGFEVYAQAHIPEYLKIKKRLYAALAGADSFSGEKYSQEVGIPMLVIEHILDELKLQGLLEMNKGWRWIHAFCISPKIKRMIEGG